MNKIYKVIWSKVKHQYVVVSELAHSNGKQSRTAKRSLRSRIAALVVCGAIAAFGVYGVLPTQQAFANGAETTQSQYIAVGDANYTDADNYRRGERYDPEKTYTQNIGGHTYVYTPTNDGNFWVRQGYTIEVIHDPRFTGAGGPDKNIIINAYRGENADTDGLVQSYQNVQESMNIHTLNGEELFSTNTSMYGGAVNTPTTGVTVVNPNDPNTLNEFIINEGTTALKGTTMIDVTGEKKSSYFQPVNYDSKTGLYHFGSISSSDNIVSTENLYVIDGIVGVFTKTPGGSSINDVYTGDVYGRNNEILMTGVDDNGNYVSYWGAEIVDPNAPIGSMPMSTLQGKFDEVEADIAKIHKDDISEIQVNHTEDGTAEDGKGGTIGLATNGGAMIPGGITVTSEATTGEDTKIKFENNKGSFTVNAGSRVVGKTGENPATEGETLTSIDINGKNYLLGGGKTYSDGDGIAIDNNEISVDLAENSGLHFVNENGEQKLANNLSIDSETGVSDAHKDGGNWTITENDGKEINRTFTNTTLDKDASEAATEIIYGTGENNKKEVYGKNYVVVDTDGNTVNISDVASASKLEKVDGNVSQNTIDIDNLTTTVNNGWTATVGDTEINVKPDENGTAGKLNFTAGNNIALTPDTDTNTINIAAEGVVSYDKSGNGYDTSSVTLGGTTYDKDDEDTGTRLTNVAYADVNGENTGSDAVNVDLLKDYVDTNGGGSWKLTTSQDDNETTVGKGNTVDLAGATKGEEEHQNIKVTQTPEEIDGKLTGNTEVKFDLDNKLVLGENNQITIDGSENNATINLGNKVTLNGADGTATIGGVKVNNTYDSNGNITSSTIDGLTNTDWNESNYDGSAKAATEGQLYDALSNITDYQLVENPASGSDGKYTVDNNGNLTLTVKDLNNPNADDATKTITISGLAKKTDVAVVHSNNQYNKDSNGNSIYSLKDTNATIQNEFNQTYINWGLSPNKISSSIALGDGAFVSEQNGSKSWGILFGNDTLTGGIAIGQDTTALNGTVNIGVKDYKGQMGDVTVSADKHAAGAGRNESYNTYPASGTGETSVGSNSYISGTLATNLGSYNMISTKYMNNNGDKGTEYAIQNTGAVVVGTLNSIESNTSDNTTSGVANSVVGMANKTQNSNGSLIFGTGNEITNSINEIPTPSTFGGSVSETADSFRDSVSDPSQANGGAVLAIGGGNKADYVLNSQLIGVQNQITGTEGNESEYNMVNGYQNTVENGSNDTVIGVNNNVTGNDNIVLGNNRNVGELSTEDTTSTPANNNVIIGSYDTTRSNGNHMASDTVVIGHNAQANGNNDVAIGSGSIANGAVGTEGYAGAKPIGTVSVGSAGSERTITNVAAGRIDATSTDAVNGSQLYDVQQEAGKHTTIQETGKNVTVKTNETTDGHLDYTVDLNDDVTLDGNIEDSNKINLSGTEGTIDVVKANGSTNINGGIITVSSGTGEGSKAIKIDGTTAEITGLSNTTLGDGSEDSTFAKVGRAATEEQLQAAMTKIDEGSYKGWKVSAEGGKASSVGSGATVDFSGVKEQLPETEGNPSEPHQNVHVTQTPELDAEGKPTGNTNVTFDLDDKLVLGKDQTTIINGDDNYIHLGSEIALDGNSGTAVIGGVTIDTVKEKGLFRFWTSCN